MKKRFLCFIVCMLMLISLMPQAFAEDGDKFKDKDWESVIADYFAEYGIDPDTVKLGYLNLVTGETHFHNGDVYQDAASTYKVPLNMLYAEKIAAGEMELDSDIWDYKYSYLLHSTIVDSSNEHAEVLWNYLGGYGTYRHMIAQYMFDDPEDADSQFYVNNFITAEECIHCLKTLYDNPERFPHIIDTMLEAEPEQYFKLRERRFPIAHKYGYNFDEYGHYLNDTAIVYTDDPIAIVFLSANVTRGYDVMTAYCTLMCDYAQYHTAERLAAEEAEKAALEERLAAEKAAEEEARHAEQSAETDAQPKAEAAKEKESMSFSSIAAFVLALALTAAAIVFVFAHHKKISILWGSVSALLLGAALIVCVAASSMGTIVTETEGDPAETVTEFFDAVTLGRYEDAYRYLEGYSTLGLENSPADTTGELLHSALRRSYSYTLAGSAEIDGLNAIQSVEFTYLDLNSVSNGVEAIIQDKLADIVAKHSRSEVYDENSSYRPEITAQAYQDALREVLSDAESCYKTEIITLNLEYVNEQWLIVPEQALMKALLGGIA